MDEVLISGKWSNYGELQPLIAELRKIALPIKLLADETASEILRRPISRLGTSIYVELQKAPLGDSERAIKRGVDVIKLHSPGRERWSRLSEQIFRVDKWNLCRG